ncbi:MAG TPA: hypothetical protein VF618_25155 [Thermoanaerobaculia bacterium]
MRKIFSVVAMLTLLVSVVTAPQAVASNDNTVLTSYYIYNGTCLEWIGEREVTCDGPIYNQGSSNGATHKVVVQIPCENGSNYVAFFERASDGVNWIQIYVLPGNGYC